MRNISLRSAIIFCLSSDNIHLFLGISLSCLFVFVSELFFGELFEIFVILLVILLPNKSPVASAVFWITLFKVILTQLTQDVPVTLPKGPLKVLTSGTYRGLSGDSQRTNTKIYNLMKRLFFRSNSPCITDLFLFFTRRTNFQKF